MAFDVVARGGEKRIERQSEAENDKCKDRKAAALLGAVFQACD